MTPTPPPGQAGDESPADDAHSLLDAATTAASAGVADAGKRLASALDGSKRMYGRVREQVLESAKAADSAIHAHPYAALAVGIGVGVGVGALLGYIIARRNSGKGA